MSHATLAAAAAESTTTTTTETGACPCAGEGGNPLGGLPFELELTMRVAGLPPVIVGEGAGELGQIITSVDPVTGGHVVDVQGVTYGALYRAAADAIEGMTAGMRAEAEACDDQDAADAADDQAESRGEGGATESPGTGDATGRHPHE